MPKQQITKDVIDRVLMLEEERLKAIEADLMKKAGTKRLTWEMRRIARCILEGQKKRDPTIAEVMQSIYANPAR